MLFRPIARVKGSQQLPVPCLQEGTSVSRSRAYPNSMEDIIRPKIAQFNPRTLGRRFRRVKEWPKRRRLTDGPHRPASAGLSFLGRVDRQNQQNSGVTATVGFWPLCKSLHSDPYAQVATMCSYAILAEGSAVSDLDIVFVVVPIPIAAHILNSAGEGRQHLLSAHSMARPIVGNEY